MTTTKADGKILERENSLEDTRLRKDATKTSPQIHIKRLPIIYCPSIRVQVKTADHDYRQPSVIIASIRAADGQ